MVSLSNSSRLPANTDAMLVNPVMFPPGRARLSTSPSATGSKPPIKTIGNSPGSVLGGYSGRRRGREDHVNFETDQFISQGGEPVELIVGGSILE